MNLIFMRHGEATDNVREIISDKEIYWSVLTDKGVESVNETIASLPINIDKIYVSSLPRTIQTANFVHKKYPSVEVVVDNRIREIKHGKFSGQQNNEELDKTREKQVAGDYFVRFGDYGENKMDIELRLSSFLKDIYEQNFDNNYILIVSHGSVTSFMKRLLNIKTPHLKTGRAEIFEDVDFSYLLQYIKKLNKIKQQEIAKRIDVVNKLDIKKELKISLVSLCKKEFNNIEFSDEVFYNFVEGLGTSKLIKNTSSEFDDGVIVVCFYHNFKNFADKWLKHYIDLNIKNFVMIDNNSSDSSTEIINSYKNKINLELWEINEKYNCFKMCGWRQQILNHYGANKTYLVVDSDELFVYKNYKNVNIDQFIKDNKVISSKSLMLDVYSQNGIEDCNLDNYVFIDNNYKKSYNAFYGERFYGGYRYRVFNIRPSLQKISLFKYTGKEICINDHFQYPWLVNKKAKQLSFLLHYKFLNGDMQKYNIFAKDGRHWNNSREYKVYVDKIKSKENFTFYDDDISICYEDFINNFKI